MKKFSLTKGTQNVCFTIRFFFAELQRASEAILVTIKPRKLDYDVTVRTSFARTDSEISGALD